MKIIHCSDLHLGKKPSGKKEFSEARYKDFFIAFEDMIDKVLTLEADVLIISGDIFDKKEINADILERTEFLLKKLKSKKENLKIIAIEGNHDSINNVEFSWLEYLKNKGYMEVYSYKKDFYSKNFFKIEDINFYPVGYPGFMIDKALEELSSLLNENEKNVIIVHTGISDGNSLPGIVSTEILDLFKGKAIYIAGGHIHSFRVYPKENPYFFIPGSLEFSNIPNEKSDRKGFVYFDTDTLEYEFIETKHRKRIKTEVFSYQNDIEEEFENFIKNINLTGEEVINIPIIIKDNEYLNIEKLEEIAEKNGALKVYIDLKVKKENCENIDEISSLVEVENLEKTIIKKWDMLNKVDDFLNNFSNLKELFLNDEKEVFEDLLDKILEEDENVNKEN